MVNRSTDHRSSSGSTGGRPFQSGSPTPDLSMRGGGPRGIVMSKAKPKNAMQTLGRIWSYLQVYRGGLIAVLILTIVATLSSLAAPYLLGVAVDDYIIPGDYAGLVKLCFILLAVYVGHVFSSWLQQFVMVKASMNSVQAMRRDIHGQLQSLPIRFFDTRTHGELMSRTTNDIENISGTLNQSVTQLISSVIALVGSVAIMLYLNVWLTLLSMVTIPLVILFTKTVAAATRKHFSRQQENLGELNSFIEETISGQKVVQVYRREQAALRRFSDINGRLTAASIRAQIFSGTVGPVMNMLNNTSFALIAAVGGWMAFRDWTTVGVVVAFLNYSKQFQRPLNDLANQFNLVQSAIAGAERVFETVDTDSEYAGEAASRPISAVKGEVNFADVSFGYNRGVPILKQVSLRAKPGQMIAIVGPTGAGKTTIINLLTRFYEIDSGRITIDGVDIRDIDKNSLRSQIGLVLQDAYLFSDTIRENLRYGRLDATDEELVEAAKLANAHRFIEKLPQGYETPLSGGGSNLSHGQRQLLTIARAILANPAILILDEATSSIDTRTEMHVQAAMRKLMNGRTSFVIAHRLGTIREADQILVIDHGEIIERGTHEELLASQGFYYNLYNSQFKRNG